jgi:hypothetical protein
MMVLMKEAFTHRAEALSADKPLVYTAMSKHLFYFRMQISTFVLEQGCVPLNPFMVFDYFLNDGIDRDVVREANNNLVKRSDEIWVFGPVSDGALAEIRLAKRAGKKVRYFAVVKSRTIKELTASEVDLEPEVATFRAEL